MVLHKLFSGCDFLPMLSYDGYGLLTQFLPVTVKLFDRLSGFIITVARRMNTADTPLCVSFRPLPLPFFGTHALVFTFPSAVWRYSSHPLARHTLLRRLHLCAMDFFPCLCLQGKRKKQEVVPILAEVIKIPYKM